MQRLNDYVIGHNKTLRVEKMAIIITDECINCGACEPECPNTAIYEGADDWRYKDGTKLTGKVILPDGTEVDAEDAQTPISDEVYFIVPGKCTECKGFHDEPQCAAVCPVDCCIPDDNHVESDETLLNRKAFLHNE
ncbi:Ferredoxin [Flavobacterium sp. TAB 87]|nr:Ferredoxin [Flavobacterium sp. TAB 87]